ncbi:MAG: hypothetical protein CMO61_05430 [Verrucomicrobiales bacterium]|jgi:hypothetical protein|nr:hypothetical protein [Verrucomicrobiales bacterium]|tara:strand:+ start:5709 stop:6005 length:297 start_codon:yes stop_codon:yes gene_type:complete
MPEENPILEFEEDSLRGKLFNFAEIPEKWHEGDYIAELDHYSILEALNESAEGVDVDVFEDGGPGISGSFYSVYATDVATFKLKLTQKLLGLLQASDQ